MSDPDQDTSKDDSGADASESQIDDDSSAPEVGETAEDGEENPDGQAGEDVEMKDETEGYPGGEGANGTATESQAGDAQNGNSEGNAMDADSNQEQAEDAPKEPTYSTRGRSAAANESAPADNWDSKAALDALEEIGRKESASAANLGISFLESLTEEERRMRTRFLPDVDGMHTLRKREVKEDLALARALVAAAGNMSKGKRSDAMDMNDDDASRSEDDRSDIGRAGTSTIEMSSRDLVVPSTAFIAPPATKSSDVSAESQSLNGIQSPLLVDNVTAFNPPRPPESIGAKKKHRMLRWERRPEDVESDLNNYRKTVQRTRQELQNAEAEYQRLDTIDAHLRWHFLNHLNLLNEEYERLNEEMAGIQESCVSIADLPTSRTRSRGASKNSQVMKDVISALKTLQSTETDSMQTDTSVETPEASESIGIGGIPLQALADRNQDTKLAPTKAASAWLVAGDKVKTPYGEGTVLKVYPPTVETNTLEKETEEQENPTEESKGASEGEATGKKDQSNQGKKEEEKLESQETSIIPPRVSVSLPYGTGFINIKEITPLGGSPSTYSDMQLVKRWKSMVESALSVSGSLDVSGMFDLATEKDSVDNEGEEGMDVDGSGENESSNNTDLAKNDDENARFVPFGSGLMPTGYGRGIFFQNLPLDEVEKGIHQALYDGKGVLGRPNNPGVPKNVKKWEEEEHEYLALQANKLQLKHNLKSQTKIRLMNERSNVTSNERYNRAKTLVLEMRTDLKTLKQRLDEELIELGITDEAQAKILSAFYQGEDAEENTGEISPLKRQRRSIVEDQMFTQGSDDDRESNEDLSGDDIEVENAAKRLRPNQ